MDNLNQKVPEYVDYLDLNHRYYIVIALCKELEDQLYDCHFTDNNGNFLDGYEGMWFDEKSFILMEKYLFNFIDAECDMLINMYEEEYADADKLPKIKEITKRMIYNSDNQDFIQLANKFLAIIEKAISLNTIVGFCF